MKFSRSLQLNCVPEWSEHYVAFQALKTLTHQIEAAKSTAGSDETAAQLEATFQAQFAEEIRKVVSFYKTIHEEIMGKYGDLQGLVAEWNAADVEAELKTVNPDRHRRPSLAVGTDLRLFGTKAESDAAANLSPEFPMKFDDAAKEVYLSLHDLHEFLYMNYTGLCKIAKGFEKHAGSQSAEELSKKVDSALPTSDLKSLDGLMCEIEKAYARICCDNNLDEATVYLRHLLHERVLHERSTVWQDMVAAERKTHEITVVSTAPAAASPAKTKSNEQMKQLGSVVLCIVLFFGLFFAPIFPKPVLNRAFAVLITSATLWCTEALPLYITALLVPFMIACSRIVFKVKPGTVGAPEQLLTPNEAALFILHSMFSPMIMLLLGGFSLSAALSKTGVTKSIATAVLSRVGRRPAVVLLAVMSVTALLCMVVSNVASPVLVFTIIGPMLRTLTADHPLSKALVLGVAYAANVGGMSSTIASPQNLVTNNILKEISASSEIGFGEWLAFSLPICIVSIFLVWAVLLFIYPCKTLLPESCVLKSSGAAWTKKQYYVSAVAILTIGLWIASKALEPIVGPMGMLSAFPLVLYFGTGILGKDDFNGFMWNIVILAMGGSALGKAVEYSGLLAHIGNLIGASLKGFSQYVTLCFFAFTILIITTFISHTVGALIFLPVIKSVAQTMPNPHPKLFVLLGGLMCSVGMGMPISGFPNMSAVSQEDATGRNIIGTMDFVKTGLLSSFLVYLTVITVGYGICSVMGY